MSSEKVTLEQLTKILLQTAIIFSESFLVQFIWIRFYRIDKGQNYFL